MPDTNHDNEQTVRDGAYFIWEREGRAEGRAHDHWHHAIREASRHEQEPDDEPLLEEEKVLAGRGDLNRPCY